MGKTTRLTTEIFINRAKEKFGDKFTFEETVYKNAKTKVRITCSKHGIFEIRPGDFLRSKFGCPKCADSYNGEKKSKGLGGFLKDARRIHGDTYDYSKVKYVNNSTKVTIICPEHGEFEQTPDAHINGKQGCPMCSGRHKKTTEEFINKANLVHNNKYDYSKVVYENNKKKVCIICPEHGEFWQKPLCHLQGQGCPICGRINSNIKRKHSNEEFLKLAKKIHGDKYDYSKTVYNGCRKKVWIICHKKDSFGNEHGGFLQSPNTHLNGCGCPKCRNWKLEEEISNFLLKNSISFAFQKKFSWLKQQSLDFYLPDFKIAIECQGIQHFTGWNKSKESFETISALDEKKKKLCENHGIRLVYFTHEKLDNINNDIYSKENVFTSLEEIKDNFFNL